MSKYMERDKFLTEQLGECWHKAIKKLPAAGYTHLGVCKCGAWSELKGRDYAHIPFTFLQQNDFSTWDGFGKLWEWSKKQRWFTKVILFRRYGDEEQLVLYPTMVDPDNFANAVYKFLREKGESDV